MRAPSGLSRPRQPGVMAVCFQGASARISHHSPLTLGQAEAATCPSSAASSCWALGVTGASEPQRPRLQKERTTSLVFGGCQACFHSSPYHLDSTWALPPLSRAPHQVPSAGSLSSKTVDERLDPQR